ncbi:MAG: response regulator [Verrucomicrobiota bacterium]
MIGSFPDLQTGDDIHIEGTTMHLLQQPGVRLVAWKKLDRPPGSAGTKVTPPDFVSSDPFFKKVLVAGLITSVAQVQGELVLGFRYREYDNYFLRVPDRVWKEFPRQDIMGRWVKVVGVYLPADPRVTGSAVRNAFGISSRQDILSIQDLVHGSSVSLETLAGKVDSNTTQPVMMEGVLGKSDTYQWVLKVEGGEIMLDWAAQDELIGRRARCVGFPVRRSAQFALIPSIVFLNESAGEPAWRFRATEYLDPIKNVAEVLALVPEEARRNKPVDLEVVVTYHHPAHYAFFVQDQTGGIYVTTENTFAEWLPGGTRIRLTGNTVEGFLKHNIQNASYEILGKSDFPAPVPCDLEQLARGDFDAQYVGIEGQIRSAVQVGNSLELKVQTKTGTFLGFVRDFGSGKDPSIWVDSIVTFTGVAGFQWENEKPTGVVLYLQDESHLEVLRARPYEKLPALMPSIDRSALAGSQLGETFRVQLGGVVTGKDGSSKWAFQTRDQGFLIDPASEKSNLAIGSFIHVVGWPRLTDEGVLIEEALITPAQVTFEVVALSDRVVPKLDFDHLHRLVTRQGHLVEVTSNASRLNFLIQSSGGRFAATLDISETPGLTSSSFNVGSFLEITGVLRSVPRDSSIGEVPTLVLRSKEDVKVLVPPDWWTPRRILIALGITGLVGLAAMTWGIVLKRKVRQQTEHIREMLVKEQQAEEKYHNLFESALDLIFITDAQGRLVTANHSFLDFFGTELKAVQGELILKWIAPQDVEKVKQAFKMGNAQQTAADDEGQVIEVELLHRNSGYAYVELSIRGLALQEGVFGYQAIARNVDARKQSELRLIQSRDSYREAHEAKTNFLTMMSHDLRTPMNGVLGMSQLLLQSNLDPEQREQVRTISAASDGVLKLMLDMLDMSRLETSRLTLVTENADLVALVDEVATTVVAEVDVKQLDLVVLSQPGMCRYVLTDASRLRQVLLNLVTNAVKFTDKGGIAIRMKGKQLQDGNCQVRFEVEDSGIPLREGDRDRLFEVLTRAGGDEPRRFGGAGLGLNLSKRIVHTMGGSIGADAISGDGSLFWVELPFKKGESIENGGTFTAGNVPPVENVLLVSDSRFVKEYFLQPSGESRLIVETLTVEDFKEELRRGKPWKGKPFSTLVVDCRLLPTDLLSSLIDLSDACWRSNFRWVLIDTASRTTGASLPFPTRKPPLRLFNPLSEASMHQFYDHIGSGEEKTDRSLADAASMHEEQVDEGKRLKSSSLRVLVVEDDSINQKLLQIYLRKAGCDATVVPEGESALQQLESHPFDVVLMDCNMAGMDGMETTRRIRSNKKFDDLVIIATTANALKGYREKCLEIGMNDFLVKPLKLDLLTKKLARIATQRLHQAE